MSPSWRNRLCIAISPEHISLLKLGRGFKPKLLARHDEAINAHGNQPLWQTATERLVEVLAQPEWQNADADIVLSNRLVRYALIPSSPQLKKYPQQEAFARHVLTNTYGAVTSQWELRIQRSKEGRPWLVSAMDQTLLESLRQVCASHRLKLRAVSPYLMPVYNRYRKVLKADPAWLVINETDCSLFALLSGGELLAVNTVKHDNISELPMLLDRENLTSTLAEPCRTVYLHAPFGTELPVMGTTEYTINRLEMVMPEGFPVLTEGLYAMAMSGVL